MILQHTISAGMSAAFMSASASIPFVYGDVTVPINPETLKHFAMISNMLDDLDSSSIDLAPIPIQLDANLNPIYFTTEELQHFVIMFEFCINPEKTEDELFQVFREMNFSSDQIFKFTILINYLDNQKFLECLTKYIAILILKGKVKIGNAQAETE